jgi:hypothetical protein
LNEEEWTDGEAKAASHFDEKKGHSIGRSYDNKKRAKMKNIWKGKWKWRKVK